MKNSSTITNNITKSSDVHISILLELKASIVNNHFESNLKSTELNYNS